MKFILGRKIEMSQIFKGGKVIPVTLIEAGPCFVTQIKKNEKDKYESVQIGFEQKKDKKIKKSEKGKGFHFLREFKDGEIKIADYELEKKIDLSVFTEGERIKISAISKGKGFQGGVKRWGFKGRNSTHGTKHESRTIGSVGRSGPEKVFKGKRMPGRMGADRVSIKNVEIIKIDSVNNLMAVKGAVQGRRGTLLEISTLGGKN